MKRIKLSLLLLPLLLIVGTLFALSACSSGENEKIEEWIFDPGANGTCVLAKYQGNKREVIIPETHDGKPVTAIASIVWLAT